MFMPIKLRCLSRIFLPALMLLTIYTTQAQPLAGINLDTIKAQRFDAGRMWAFDFPPLDYFRTEYNFSPDAAWMEKARMSALRFASYCSASFVSADGLVMTNHHCGRESITAVTKDGEDLSANGFIAATLEEERPVEGLFVDQLVMIQDVTRDIQAAIDAAGDAAAKETAKQEKIDQLTTKLESEKGLKGEVVTFFNGGKYSLYGYKTYTDVRLVFAPETQLGFFGGDPDNFTYPRYSLDCSFFRVYDNGKPLQTSNYFTWSANGAKEGDAVFVIGNPGSTNRLNTVAQLQYSRDVEYPQYLQVYGNMVKLMDQVLAQMPEPNPQLVDMRFQFSNSDKAITGMLKGLKDETFMARKRDFERTFREKVMAKPALRDQYGSLWDSINKLNKTATPLAQERFALQLPGLFASAYLRIPSTAMELAQQLKLPDAEREDPFKTANLDKTLFQLYPTQLNTFSHRLRLIYNLEAMQANAPNHPAVKALLGGRTPEAAAEYLLANSIFGDRARFVEAVNSQSPALVDGTDPLLQFAAAAEARVPVIDAQIEDMEAREANFSQALGRALYEVYGTTLPPDATFTLRIADGVVKNYKYNGTVAPPVTTFYGLYDRYYSNNQGGDWALPDRWVKRPAGFDLSKPFNFVSTNDIIGGNSGSPVINKDLQVVGLAFDGNIESLPGDFIFDTEFNRCVSVHSAGMLEAIDNLYLFKRMAAELRTGKIPAVMPGPSKTPEATMPAKKEKKKKKKEKSS